jgi:AraC-like DNA-binding protein
LKTLQYQFTELSYHEDFDYLARVFGTEVVNNTINVPPSMGTGSILRVVLAEGLQIVKWETCLHQPLELIKVKTSPGSDKVFTLTYSFTPGRFLLRSASLNTELELQGAINLLFDSGNDDLNFTMPAGIHANCVIISLSAEWIKNEFSQSNEQLKKLVTYLINTDKPALFYETVPETDQKVLGELYNHFTTAGDEPFYIKGSTMLLISYFFNSFFKKAPEEVENNNILYYDKIKNAEQILIEHLNRNLPSVSDIAKQVGLSQSTLKRYFKVIFNTSIYECYLQKKMEHAKTQLMEHKLPVKEVAYMLGYEKSSSFIRIFKKYYKLPPGLMRKEESQKGAAGK